MKECRSEELSKQTKIDSVPVWEILMTYLNKVLAKPTVSHLVTNKGRCVEVTGVNISFEEALKTIEDEMTTELQKINLHIVEGILRVKEEARDLTFGNFYRGKKSVRSY